MRDDTAVTQVGGEPAAATPSSAEPDRYVLLDRLGEGGMGVVWKAHDRVLDRSVALKVLHDRFLGAEHQERLVAEARAMARLSHPNVVAVYDAGERDGRAYLTMELVRGEALSSWLERPRRWQAIVAVFLDAARGVAAAHEARIVHRDLKPSNILVGDDGRARVADFGIADAAAPLDGALAPGVATLTAGVAGTPAYMAIERLRGEPADERSDQFSFCAALYEALHGRRPFVADTIEGLREACEGPSPAPVRPVPRWLHAAVARGLAADPAARHPSMAALLGALDRRPRRWLLAGIAGGAVLAGGAAVALALGGRAPEIPCTDMSRHVRPLWNDEVKARIAAAFASSERPYAAQTWRDAQAQLDRYAATWVAVREEACRATRVDGERDDETERIRGACLNARLDGFASLIAEYGSGRAAVVDAAWSTSRDLHDPRACLDASPADQRAPQAELRRGVAALEGDRLDEAIAILHDLEQQVGRLGARAVLVEVRIALARALMRRGHLDDASVTLTLATEALDPDGVDPHETAISLAESELLERRGQKALAARELNRAWKLAAYLEGPMSLSAAAVRLRRGELLLEVGDLADARDDAEAAVAIFAALGDGHPLLVRARGLLARVPAP